MSTNSMPSLRNTSCTSSCSSHRMRKPRQQSVDMERGTGMILTWNPTVWRTFSLAKAAEVLL